jgi:hypothetical protein
VSYLVKLTHKRVKVEHRHAHYCGQLLGADSGSSHLCDRLLNHSADVGRLQGVVAYDFDVLEPVALDNVFSGVVPFSVNALSDVLLGWLRHLEGLEGHEGVKHEERLCLLIHGIINFKLNKPKT